MEMYPMTPAGYLALQEELRNLKAVVRPKVIADIAEARSHGDLSENALWKASFSRLVSAVFRRFFIHQSRRIHCRSAKSQMSTVRSSSCVEDHFFTAYKIASTAAAAEILDFRIQCL